MLRSHKSQGFFTRIHYIGLNKHKEIIMLNFIKKLFGKTDTAVEVQPVEAVAEVSQPKTLEFHEEIRAQVEAEKTFPVQEKKPAVKAKSNKGKKAPAKATAKKAPAKKSAPKKSKE